jgi:hypothetical protein
MSDQHIPVTSDIPSPMKGRRKRLGRLLSRTGVAAMAAGVGLTASLVGGSSAYADTLTNGPTISLTNYFIPTTAPAYQSDAPVLSTANGILGNPAIIGMTGSATDDTANTYVASIPGGSSAWGTQTATSVYSSGSANQVWYFQRVGWLGVNTPISEFDSASGGAGQVELAVPVYRILNYNNGTYTCLDAYGGSGAAGSIVDSYGCDPNQVNQTNQLWAVSSPAQTNDLIQVPSGTFLSNDGEMIQAGQEFTDSLQPADPQINQLTSLQDSVLENVASLAANGWNTATTPVLSATYTDLQGTNSGLVLQDQTWPANTANSTWDILADSPPQSTTGSGGSSCTGFAVLFGC